jgi:hypothetical protein
MCFLQRLPCMHAIAKFEKVSACLFRVFRNSTTAASLMTAQKNCANMAYALLNEKLGCPLKSLVIAHFWNEVTEDQSDLSIGELDSWSQVEYDQTSIQPEKVAVAPGFRPLRSFTTNTFGTQFSSWYSGY